eukprot:TRINITY_DN2444_c0_g2_i6.p1 TRINITY_DN2444_c0_g2~~TRINITY_DN2444_c0_g2_i6.p1  ORF type:complete len:207 (-),score=29.33 TRINITY_DN2444_c0_g2_i6:3-623(-)
MSNRHQKALFDAVRKHATTVEQVKRLIARGAKANGTDDYGRCALHYAVKYCSADVTLFLIRKHAPINLEDDEGMTPLHCACLGSRYSSSEERKSRFECATLLLQHGARIDHQSKLGYTPLHRACMSDNPLCGARVDILTNKGESIFDIATHWTSDDSLRILQTHAETQRQRGAESTPGASVKFSGFRGASTVTTTPASESHTTHSQ